MGWIPTPGRYIANLLYDNFKEVSHRREPQRLEENPLEAEPVVASIAYPHVGGSQHLTLVRHSKSQVRASAHLLPWEQLGNTVLAGAFTNKRVYLPTPLEPPYDRLLLPPLRKTTLRDKNAYTQDGKLIGKLLSVPGIFTRANRILQQFTSGNPYNYELAIADMAVDATRLLASLLRSGIVRVRERPGLMAHIQAIPELAKDEIGISIDFAAKLFKRISKDLTLIAGDAMGLDGFPVWGIRFPMANEYGIQPLTLRVLPGSGKYIGFNPWNLKCRLLGDEDGDLGFLFLRLKEVLDGHLSLEKRPRLSPEWRVEELLSRVSLQSIASPDMLELSDKEKERCAFDFRTPTERLQAIQDADTRGHVAIYTMAIGWWVARTLAVGKAEGTQKAYIDAFNTLEWFMENCMDARKGDSALSGTAFDSYEFMDCLLRGGILPTNELREIGVPEDAMRVLETAWLISRGNLGAFCSQSPVYDAIVNRRNDIEGATHDMLIALEQLNVRPEEVYRTIINDLTCVAVVDDTGITQIQEPEVEAPPLLNGEDPFEELPTPSTASFGKQWGSSATR